MPWKPLSVTKAEIEAAVRAFSKKARFLVDENLDAETAPFLRSKGWNVETVAGGGLRGHPDENVLALAQREDRVLLTHDADYLDNHRFPPHRNPGVVVLPGGDGDVRALVQALFDLLAVFAPYREFIRGAKIVFRADRVVSMTARVHVTGRMETTLYRLRPQRDIETWVEDDT